jgi:hypothetical protein
MPLILRAEHNHHIMFKWYVKKDYTRNVYRLRGTTTPSKESRLNWNCHVSNELLWGVRNSLIKFSQLHFIIIAREAG